LKRFCVCHCATALRLKPQAMARRAMSSLAYFSAVKRFLIPFDPNFQFFEVIHGRGTNPFL
jgi:hypothetical protein